MGGEGWLAPQGIWAVAVLRLAVVLGPATDRGKREGHRRETQAMAGDLGLLPTGQIEWLMGHLRGPEVWSDGN